MQEHSQHLRVFYCEVLLVRVLLGSILLECSSISGFNTLDTRSTPSILDVCTAGTLVLEDMYCSYSQYSQYLGLQYCSYSKYSEYLGIQYCSYSRVLVEFAPSVMLILQVLAVLGPLPVLAVLRPSILRAITVVLFLSKNKKQKRSGSPLREIVKHKHIFYISYLQFLFFNASFFSEIGFW